MTQGLRDQADPVSREGVKLTDDQHESDFNASSPNAKAALEALQRGYMALAIRDARGR